MVKSETEPEEKVEVLKPKITGQLNIFANRTESKAKLEQEAPTSQSSPILKKKA